jgi:hypothetical protein
VNEENMKSTRLRIGTSFALVFALGCGSEEEEKKDPCENTSCRAAGTPGTAAVSFMRDVAPIFQKSCNEANCHGYAATPTATLPRGGLFLGTTSAVDGAVVVPNLLAESEEVMGRNIVVPNDPANSVLMFKVDGCQNSKGLTCALRAGEVPETQGAPCGDPMPPPSYPGLCSGDVEVLRSWIAQGAMNN